MHAISQESLKRLHEFTLQNLANTAWSYAKMRCDDETLIDSISENVITHIYDAPCQDLVNTASAFYSSGLMSPGVRDAITEEAQRRINEFETVQKRRLEEIFLQGGCED
eukprot:gnl/MRDRNA2_/MRDRNA2_85886_c0_seq1.p1 gnl/MRDRNA2_/MRDRNA2_85886_c0~~gnl/MRDRNA2_/MRDRNA2_85886_c0_seq1.p1  ORF type:complete len:109 (+),score=13.87 gnl/MRDRNA2_/MRDRNA2_85886_c0_seq1:701-1027(+)